MSKIKEKLLKKKGSILVYSLIIMFVILSISLGITKITLTKQKTASNINRSTQAFQVANSGVEKVLQKIKGRSGSINNISGINCSGNQSIFPNEAGGTVTVTYLDSSGKTLNCTDNISKIAKIKSVGEINKTKRAIEVALAAGGGSGITGGCTIRFYNYSRYDTVIRWGKGCRDAHYEYGSACYYAGSCCKKVSDPGYLCGPVSDTSVGGRDANYCLCIKN